MTAGEQGSRAGEREAMAQTRAARAPTPSRAEPDYGAVIGIAL